MIGVWNQSPLKSLVFVVTFSDECDDVQGRGPRPTPGTLAHRDSDPSHSQGFGLGASLG